RLSAARAIASFALANATPYAANSCPSRIGTASCIWVRPAFTMPSNSRPFSAKLPASRSRTGYSPSSASSVPTRIAVGNTASVAARSNPAILLARRALPHGQSPHQRRVLPHAAHWLVLHRPRRLRPIQHLRRNLHQPARVLLLPRLRLCHNSSSALIRRAPSS